MLHVLSRKYQEKIKYYRETRSSTIDVSGLFISFWHNLFGHPIPGPSVFDRAGRCRDGFAVRWYNRSMSFQVDKSTLPQRFGCLTCCCYFGLVEHLVSDPSSLLCPYGHVKGPIAAVELRGFIPQNPYHSTAVAEMEKVVQLNAANSEETASTSEEIYARAEQMEEMVNGLLNLVGGEGKQSADGESSRKLPQTDRFVCEMVPSRAG